MKNLHAFPAGLIDPKMRAEAFYKRKEVSMTESIRIFKAIEFGFVAAVIALFFVLAIAGLVIGFELNHWPNWQARFVGIVAAVASVAAATIAGRAAFRN